MKNSKTKLNTTMAIYNKKANFLPATITNRETHNQSQNSRQNLNKKKEIAYMKQMMNKTVLIQNQDYNTFNPHVSGGGAKLRPRAELKKHSLVVPKQVVMVRWE